MTGVWPALFLSVQIAATATLLGALGAVPLAYCMSRRRFHGKSIVEALITLPLVLPPTVVGYAILMTMGRRAWLGRWYESLIGHSVVFSFEGAVLAAAVISFPLLYLPSRAGFTGVSRELEETARMMGASAMRVFFRISLPLARRGIFSGLLLAFARALGEFGATVIVYGWTGERPTLPISVYAAYEQGEPLRAWPAVLALTFTSLVLIIVYNRTSAGRQD